MRKITQLVQAVKDHAAQRPNTRWDVVTHQTEDSEIEEGLINNRVASKEEAIGVFRDVVKAADRYGKSAR